MSFVAVPDSVPMVTTVASVRVPPPLSVAVTVTVVAASSSPRLDGLALNVIPDRESSSVIVVVTVDVPRDVVPPPPVGWKWSR